MATAISNISSYLPICWKEAPTGLLYAAQGLDYMIQWDGIATSIWTVGLFAPTVSPTMNFSGSGNSTGNYLAVLRWVDD